MTELFLKDAAASRFELRIGEYIAYADYRLEKDILTIRYVFAPDALRGTGAAGRLMEKIMEEARANTLKIVPICGYAASWMRKHKEHQNLMA